VSSISSAFQLKRNIIIVVEYIAHQSEPAVGGLKIVIALFFPTEIELLKDLELILVGS